MGVSSSLTVRGFLADDDTGDGLGGLRVELWHANGHGPNLVSAADSDESGQFELSLTPEDVDGLGDTESADVELRVIDDGELIQTEARELPIDRDTGGVDLAVPVFAPPRSRRALVPYTRAVPYEPDAPADVESYPLVVPPEDIEAAPSPTSEIFGRVRGAAPEGTTVRSVVRTLRGGVIHEDVVSEGVIESNGSYRLTFDRPATAESQETTSVSVELRTAEGDLIGQSVPVVAPGDRTRIDVRPSRGAAAPSEYTLLEREVATLEAGAEGLDNASEDVLAEVSEWLDVEPERLSVYQQSRALERDTGVAGSAFYALGRNGVGPSLVDLADVPVHELRTTLEEAAADRIIEAERLGNLDHLVEQIASLAVEHATRPNAQAQEPGLCEILAAADLPREAIAHVVRRYQVRTNTNPDLLTDFSEDESLTEGLDEDTAETIDVALRLGELVGPDPDLHRKMHDLRRQGAWQKPQDLSRMSFDDWCDVLDEVAEVQSEDAEADGEEREAADQERESLIEARAESIMDALEEEYPSEFIRNHMIASEALSEGARTLLDRARDHDLTASSIRQRVDENPQLVHGVDEPDAVIEEIEKIERVSRVTRRADEVDVLVGSGLNSAMEIASIPPQQFASVFGEALGGRAQAARIHANAQQTAAATKFIALKMIQATQRAPFVLGAPAIKDTPDAKTLFQAAGGFCDCEHCGSVYSPAAYFVDLLRYLDLSSPDRLAQLELKLKKRTSPTGMHLVKQKLKEHQPLDVLLGRRPDLALIPLTCENTLTALPYIDLVNELLEAAITGGVAAFDTGKIPTDVLVAVPQNLSREAYQQLQQAVHPLTLPYHQPLALARANLAHLGVTRLELMRVLGRGEALRLAIVAEALGMSTEEFMMVAQPPADPWRHLGFDADQRDGVPFLQVLTQVPAFLDAAGITFQNLIDLIDTRFLNQDQQLSLDAASPDCDPDTIKIAGLDEPRLLRMLRMIRLRRRLNWTFAQLDQALRAFGATDLDPAVLEKLTIAQDLAKKLDRPLADLLVLWSPIETWGKGSLFERLFQTRAVLWATKDERTFQLRADRQELTETADTVDGVASALLAAFRITSEDLALIRALIKRRGTEPRLDLAGLSAIYQVVVLSRALQLRIPGLDSILRLAPPDADPFSKADPAATQKFVEIVKEVQASEFTPERLAYLFRHEWDPRRDPSPLQAQVDAVLASIRSGLADAFAETSPPAELTSETLRQKLGAVLDAALLDAALEALDPRSTVTPEKRREFFDRHLARIFSDAPAAATRLFEPVPDGTPRDALEPRWRVNVGLVLDHLLPMLRTQKLRGAVVQTLSDTLGLSSPSTARLLDVVLKSRTKAGEPLLRDFQSMLGTGLTGAYFANNALTGEPAVTRVDPEISFTWAGAPPADGIPGKEFSARWSGHFLARTKSPHTFYLTTDGAVRMTLKVGGTERVLIDRPTGAPKAVEHVSDPVTLDPRELAEIKIEYKNLGAPAALSLQFGTGPGAKQPVPTSSLHAVDGLTTFAPIEQSYRRLHKAAMILTGFNITDAQLEWLTGTPPYLNLDTLPMEPGKDVDGWALFQRWRQLAALFTLRRKLPRSNVDLFEVFRATTMPEAIDKLVLATGWDRATIEAFLGPEGFAIDAAAGLRPPESLTEEPSVVRLARAIDVHRRLGVTPATSYAWANTVPDSDMAIAVVQAVKARYDEKRWLEIARSLNDPLRAERRDALVAYLLPRLRDRGIRNRNQLFEYFLIDVDMNPCMLTSRIRQATAAVQTFFQRALMNLEPLVPPRIIDDGDWKWLKNYRVWEANRKVFLYPENWIEPDLRDDKSPLFQVLERTILQQEITDENVEAAFIDYLDGLDEVARLDVRSVWFEKRTRIRGVRDIRAADNPKSEWDFGTYHIFARTFNAPHIWFYRRLENGRTWTAWEKIDADIEGDHLVPVIFQRRMHLFWTQFREVTKPTPKMDREQKGAPPDLGKDWEIHLSYSVYDRGRWSRKRMSSGGVVDWKIIPLMDVRQHPPLPKFVGSAAISPTAYTLRPHIIEGGDLPELDVYLYCRDAFGGAGDHPTLHPSHVHLIAKFELAGCNGALVPDREQNGGPPNVHGLAEATRKRGRVRAAMGVSRPVVHHAPQGFHLWNGGPVNAPSGYQISGMGYSGTRSSGALLALPAGDSRGIAVALPHAHGSRKGTRVIPVRDPVAPERPGLYPFFFQDRFRSYFVRPISTGWKPAVLRAVPLRAFRPVIAAPPRPKPKKRFPFPDPLRLFGGRREDVVEDVIEDISTMSPEAIDAWEDEQDDLWHPDDASEALSLFKRKRRRKAPARPAPAPAPRRAPAPARPGPRRPAPAAAPAPRVHYRRIAAYDDVRLQFTSFEHTDTCRFISTLKAKGVGGLLDFSTTRQHGRDHALDVSGKWDLRRPTWFQRYYGGGPLFYAPAPPHLDVAFEVDHPYAVYNWELFFHAPLQVAVRLAKDGRHEDAQRWFHFIFDPTTDSSSPSPKRFWRFAPFYENNEYESARELVQLMSYQGNQPDFIRRNVRVREQLAAWWEKPFSPHVIARLRISAYQKAVVMKYIDNLVEWGDKLFRRDTMETIQEATQIYILAANILGPRPEKIPPIVTKAPLTFQKMRGALDLFSNVEIKLENLQVRRPFRIAARPESGAAASVLGMATQYFCTPANPQLDKYWDTVADRLFKIRNCMNIQGIVRQLPLFDPPIDPGLLVRAAAAGVDLGSVIASLNAPPPHYRFRFLVDRAARLADEIRSFGAMTLRVLERRDAEGLASLRASNETSLLEAVRDIKKKQVRQVEEELAEFNLQKEHIDVQIQHLNQQLSMLMNPQEAAAQKSMSAAQVISGIAEGIDLVSKVMHAIPDFQTGAAGAFSSPFVTLQLGGQMFGDIASAFSASFEKVMSKNETEADLAAAQAEYQRRREEWQHELELLQKEKAKVEKHIIEIQLKLEIQNAELRRHDIEVENSNKIGRFLRDKYTNEQLYGWMLGQVSGVYFQAYKVAFDAAQQAERAFRFERGEQASSFIEFSYWDSLKKGLFAGERLLIDLRRLEAAYVEGNRRGLEVTRHISLREDYPMAWLELQETGRCQVEVSEALLDGDFPGHYFRRMKTASLTMTGTFKAQRNVNCTLTLLENRIRTDANASGSYAQSGDSDDARFLVNIAPIQAVATSRPDNDPGLFRLTFDDERYLPFEGAGAISTWRLELHQSDNAIDLASLSDVVLTLSYTARTGGGALEAAARSDREKATARGGLKPEAQLMISVKQDLPAVWKQLTDAAAGTEVEAALPLDADRFSGRFRGLDLRIERVMVVARTKGTLGNDALRVRLDPPKGSGTTASGWAPAFPRSKAVKATAEISGPAGAWKLAVTSTGAKLGDQVDDLVLVFDVRAKKS